MPGVVSYFGLFEFSKFHFNFFTDLWLYLLVYYFSAYF